ncbi:hypothetical protein PR048_021538 [Dryococelus australis]|uniref:Uncharacterized protein n=1 Tax=Dryococelus australis TaxID=614101 RepID=A0ABQ9GYN6_9NEOP|nr:hypothetical protein PR048_021538 [Dryococelus australis]
MARVLCSIPRRMKMIAAPEYIRLPNYVVPTQCSETESAKSQAGGLLPLNLDFTMNAEWEDKGPHKELYLVRAEGVASQSDMCRVVGSVPYDKSETVRNPSGHQGPGYGTLTACGTTSSIENRRPPTILFCILPLPTSYVGGERSSSGRHMHESSDKHPLQFTAVSPENTFVFTRVLVLAECARRDACVDCWVARSGFAPDGLVGRGSGWGRGCSRRVRLICISVGAVKLEETRAEIWRLICVARLGEWRSGVWLGEFLATLFRVGGSVEEQIIGLESSLVLYSGQGTPPTRVLSDQLAIGLGRRTRLCKGNAVNFVSFRRHIKREQEFAQQLRVVQNFGEKYYERTFLVCTIHHLKATASQFKRSLIGFLRALALAPRNMQAGSLLLRREEETMVHWLSRRRRRRNVVVYSSRLCLTCTPNQPQTVPSRSCSYTLQLCAWPLAERTSKALLPASSPLPPSSRPFCTSYLSLAQRPVRRVVQPIPDQSPNSWLNSDLGLVNNCHFPAPLHYSTVREDGGYAYLVYIFATPGSSFPQSHPGAAVVWWSEYSPFQFPVGSLGFQDDVAVGRQALSGRFRSRFPTPLHSVRIAQDNLIHISLSNLYSVYDAGETGDSRENPPTNGIVWHDSHMRKSGVTRPGVESE